MTDTAKTYELRSGQHNKNTMPDNVVFTPEQFQQLLENMKTTLATASTSTPQGENSHGPPNNGNFAECKSRFAGNKGEAVEAFIDAIVVYKECVGVSDNNALKGLPMLLDGAAATWWQGTKASVTTWPEAVESLRRSYGEQKPNYRIFRELFSREQRSTEPTDIFVSHARALLSKLSATPVLDDAHKLDMVYGLLHQSIRKMIPRDQIGSFEGLISKARQIEDLNNENKLSTTEEKPRRVMCHYCRQYGHIQADCQKLAAKMQEAVHAREAPTNTRRMQAPTTSSNPNLVCYGCRQPGHIRSQCPNKKHNPTASMEVLSADLIDGGYRAFLPVSIASKQGLAFVDTGAKRSMAGHKLYQHLKKLEIPSCTVSQIMTMADGNPIEVMTEIFKVEIVLKGRRFLTTLTSVPEHCNSKTLLGMDFIKQTGMILDLTEMKWRFRDAPGWFPLVDESTVGGGLPVDAVEMEPLREDEGTELSADEKQKVSELLASNKEVFKNYEEPTPFAEHCINLTCEQPISTPPYRLSPQRRSILEKEIEQMIDDNIIEECDSPFAAPVVMVPKRTGGYRVCVDFRKLNSVTVPDRYPLPRIDDVLHAAQQCFFMSTMDLKSGFWQVPVREGDKDKTAFVTPFGLYRFLRMPFGLRNSPATFQRLIDRFKAGLPDVCILAYMDDLIVLSGTFAQHLNDLQLVFDRLKVFRLSANRQKCVFACSQIKFLGHIIANGGISPDPEKISAITCMAPPVDVKQLMSFLQTCSWFRRFIPGFSGVAEPLTRLTRKKAQWVWDAAQVEAFEKLKQLLTTAPLLRQADPTLPYVLKTDASAYAIGACLLQGEDADERPVEYASRLLTAPERNYTTTEREALAIVFGVQKFRGYLEGARVVVASDHQPLKWLMTLKSPSGRLARWALLLQSFDLQVNYIPGKSNVVADTLSRPPLNDDDVNVCPVEVNLPRVSASELRTEQLKDEVIEKIVMDIEGNNEEELKRWLDRGYIMTGGLLYRYNPDSESCEPQLVVPKQKVGEVLAECHDSALAGHPGVERTIDRVTRRYFWSTLRKDVRHHVQSCVECQRYKASNMKPAGLLQTPVMAQRFESLAMDLYGPLPKTPDGKRWVFAVEDTATRWLELFPLEKATAEACAKCLVDEVILRYGTPRKVISDNGTQFVGEVMQQVAYCLGFTQVLTPLYYPAANPEERRNRELTVQLSILVEREHDMWSAALPTVRFAMNNAVHAAVGKTPAYLSFGREMRTPLEVHHDLRSVVENENFVAEITPHLKRMADTLKDARERSEGQQDRAKKYADQHRRLSPAYEVGDRVLVDVHTLSRASSSYTSKFAPRRDGPYIIIEKKSPVSYVIAAEDAPHQPLGKYHVSALRPFISREGAEVDSRPVAPLRRRGRPRKGETTEREPSPLRNGGVEECQEQPQPTTTDGLRCRKKKACFCC